MCIRYNYNVSSRRRKYLSRLAIASALALGSWAVPASGQTAGIQFFPTGTPGADTVYLAGTGSDRADGLLILEVRANDVTDLYGVSFTLQFPKKLVRFPKSRPTAIVEGPFLSENGAVETILVFKDDKKNIIVGLTRKGEVTGVSGSGVLLTLEFRGLGVAGRKVFRLRQTDAADSQMSIIEGFSWFAGRIEVSTE